MEPYERTVTNMATVPKAVQEAYDNALPMIPYLTKELVAGGGWGASGIPETQLTTAARLQALVAVVQLYNSYTE